ncbi:MAG: HAD-IC family P-type ATPase [Lysobacteraceae bacterium]
MSREELLASAVAVESLSDHPLAAAIARDGRKRLGGREVSPPAAWKTSSVAVSGPRSAARRYGSARPRCSGTDGLAPLGGVRDGRHRAVAPGQPASMVVRQGTRTGRHRPARHRAAKVRRRRSRELRALGITRMIMISGDHQRVAAAIASEVGLDEAWGDLMPEDKVEAIRKLHEQDKVAMVGDGVNDAPAMANATVGISMGAAGSDVALETADVALMADDLRHLPFAVGLSRHTRAVILQNVYVSLGIVAFLVPATIFGLGIGPAVAIHEGSTLLVVFNALRLLAYRDPRIADR